jgi:hypothetical protein
MGGIAVPRPETDVRFESGTQNCEDGRGATHGSEGEIHLTLRLPIGAGLLLVSEAVFK